MREGGQPDTLLKDPVIELLWQNTVTERDNTSRFQNAPQRGG